MSVALLLLGSLAAAGAASVGYRPLDIPVEVVYDSPGRSFEPAPAPAALAGLRNLQERPQLSPEEIVEADVLDIPENVAKSAALENDVARPNELKQEVIIIDDEPTTTKKPPRQPNPFENLQNTFNAIGSNIGTALNNIRPSVILQNLANRNQNSTGNKDDESSSQPPPNNFLGNVQQNVNGQLENFAESVNKFINNLRPKPATPEDEESTAPPQNNPVLDAIQTQFNNGMTNFQQNINNALSFINRGQNPEPQDDDQPQPPSFIQSIQNSAQQFSQQFSSFVNNFGQNQGGQSGTQNEEQPSNPNFGQQVVQFFQNGMNNFMQQFNNQNGQAAQSEENTGTNNTPWSGIQNAVSNFGQQVNNFITGGGSSQNNVQGEEESKPPGPLQSIQNQIQQAGQNFISTFTGQQGNGQGSQAAAQVQESINNIVQPIPQESPESAPTK